jgi:hypothetical protein
MPGDKSLPAIDSGDPAPNRIDRLYEVSYSECNALSCPRIWTNV